MYQSNLSFDKNKDIKPVDQFGYIDLVQSFQNGYVPGNSADVLERYNDIEDPRSIIGRPADVFEAMRMQDYLVADAKERGSKGSPNGGENE